MLKLLLVAALALLEGDGTTPLHRAVYNNDVSAVEKLIKSGADVNARNEYGSTPMLEAVSNGNVTILERLLKAGAEVNSAGPDGMTPLMIVARGTNTSRGRLEPMRGLPAGLGKAVIR